MMKEIVVKISPELLAKETPEQRKERLRYSNVTRTRVVPNKKRLSRSKQKQLDRNDR